jgi:hypothetical protein
MTVWSQFVRKCTDLPPLPPTNNSDGLDDFDDSDSDVTEVNNELPLRRGKEKSQGDSDDDTVTEVSHAVHHSVADQKSRNRLVSGTKPALVFINPKASVPETKQVKKTANSEKMEANMRKSFHNQKKPKSNKAFVIAAAKRSSNGRKTKQPKQVKGVGSSGAIKQYNFKGTRFLYEQMKLSFCNRPTNSVIKEPKYYMTLKFVAHSGLADLSKTTTHDILFCYCTECDQIIEYCAGYYKGVQRTTWTAMPPKQKV